MKVLMKSRVPNSLTILLCEQEKDDVPTETIRMKDLDFHIENIDYGDTTAPYPHQGFSLFSFCLFLLYAKIEILIFSHTISDQIIVLCLEKKEVV